MVNHIDDRPLEAPLGDDGNPVLQVDRLDAVVKHALNSENWDQSSWMRVQQGAETSCGTTYCIAGFAAVEFAGLKPVLEDRGPFVDRVNVDGNERLIQSAARDYLGLTWREANHLFASGNDVDDVVGFAARIKNGDYR